MTLPESTEVLEYGTRVERAIRASRVALRSRDLTDQVVFNSPGHEKRKTLQMERKQKVRFSCLLRPRVVFPVYLQAYVPRT